MIIEYQVLYYWYQVSKKTFQNQFKIIQDKFPNMKILLKLIQIHLIYIMEWENLTTYMSKKERNKDCLQENKDAEHN